MYKHILIATDGSQIAQNAIAEGLSLATSIGAKATVITVTEHWKSVVTGVSRLTSPPNDYDVKASTEAAGILEGALEVARKLDATCETMHVKDQHPAEGIVNTARNLGCDLIVIASHGRRGIKRVLLGSQANEVVTLSTIPVLIWKSPAD